MVRTEGRILLVGAVLIGTVVSSSPAVASGVTPVADAVASRAFDRAKPAIVRIETHASAQYSMTLADVSDAALTAYLDADRQRLLDSGSAADPASLINNVLHDLTAAVTSNPDQFFTKGTDTRHSSVSTATVGSGAIVSSGGLILTSSSVAAPSARIADDLRARGVADLHDQLANESDGAAADLANSLLSDNPVSGIDQSVVNTYTTAWVAAQNAVSMKSIVATDGPTITTRVQLGPAVPGSTGPTTFSASVLSAAGSTEQPGVAVLRIAATDLPTVAVGSSPANVANGQPVVLAGYDAVRPDGSDLAAGVAIRPTRTGTPARFTSATSKLTLGAPISPGKIGGPVLDRNGDLVGVILDATNGARTDAVEAQLAAAKVGASDNPEMALYRRGIDQYVVSRFRRALPPFQKLALLDPRFPYLSTLISNSRTAIATGKDRTPAGLPWPAVALAIAGEVAVGAGLVWIVRGRRRPPTAAPNAPLDPTLFEGLPMAGSLALQLLPGEGSGDRAFPEGP